MAHSGRAIYGRYYVHSHPALKLRPGMTGTCVRLFWKMSRSSFAEIPEN